MRWGRASIGGGLLAVLLLAVDLAALRALVSRGSMSGDEPIEFWAGVAPIANAAAIPGDDLA